MEGLRQTGCPIRSFFTLDLRIWSGIEALGTPRWFGIIGKLTVPTTSSPSYLPVGFVENCSSGDWHHWQGEFLSEASN
jgi:hypothetical protein